MKAWYRTVHVNLGGRAYAVECKVLPPRAPARASFDSPRYLDPGSPPRVQVLRILRDRIDVTKDPDELLWFTRSRVTEEAEREALHAYSRFQTLRRQLRRRVGRQARGRTA